MALLPRGLPDAWTPLFALALCSNCHRLASVCGNCVCGLLVGSHLSSSICTPSHVLTLILPCSLRPRPLPCLQLTTLPQTVFAALSSIQFLDLTYNNLTTVPGGMFSNLIHLRGLSLAANFLAGGSLGTSSFAGLSSLEVCKRWPVGRK